MTGIENEIPGEHKRKGVLGRFMQTVTDQVLLSPEQRAHKEVLTDLEAQYERCGEGPFRVALGILIRIEDRIMGGVQKGATDDGNTSFSTFLTSETMSYEPVDPTRVCLGRTGFTIPREARAEAMPDGASLGRGYQNLDLHVISDRTTGRPSTLKLHVSDIQSFSGDGTLRPGMTVEVDADKPTDALDGFFMKLSYDAQDARAKTAVSR